MLTYENLANPGLAQGNPSSKLFRLKNFSVDNIQFSAQHKKSAKINKKQYIVTKKFNQKICGKSYLRLWWSQRDAVTHQGVSVISQA